MNLHRASIVHLDFLQKPVARLLILIGVLSLTACSSGSFVRPTTTNSVSDPVFFVSTSASRVSEYSWRDGRLVAAHALPPLPGGPAGPLAASPDGTSLAGTRLVNNVVVPFVADMATGKSHLLTPGTLLIWSVDGHELCGTRKVAGGGSAVVTVDAKTGSERVIADLPPSPDVNFYTALGCAPLKGRIIVVAFGMSEAFLPAIGLVVLDLSGRIVRRLEYGSTGGQLFISVSRDASVVAENQIAGAVGATVRDMSTGRIIAAWPGRYVRAFSMDGQLALTDQARTSGGGAPNADIRRMDGHVLWASDGAVTASEFGPEPNEFAVEMRRGTSPTSQITLILPDLRLVTLATTDSLIVPAP